MGRRADAQRLQELSAGALQLIDPQDGWPARAIIRVDDDPTECTLWIGPIGHSHRGRDNAERRFQNPGSNRPIWISDALPLLIGLWEADPSVPIQQPVIVAADPFRRAGKTTRFSVFIGLDLLTQAAQSGWSSGVNSDGELLCCCHPKDIGLLAVATFPERFRLNESSTVPLVGLLGARNDARSDIARLAMSGLTLQQIADRQGITRERVRQIIKKNWPELTIVRKHLSARLKVQAAARTAETAKATRWLRLREEFAARGIDPDQVLIDLQRTRLADKTATRFKLEIREVQALHDASPDTFALAGQRARTAERFSDDQLLEYLRLAAKTLGVSKLTTKSYSDFAARQNFTTEAWPSWLTIMKRFGGWVDACQAAGLTVSKIPRPYRHEFPAARCREFVDQYVRSTLNNRERASYAGYSAWARSNGGPSAPTIRNHLGRWSDVLAASLSRIDR